MSKSKHNYTQYSKKNEETYVAPEVTEVVETVETAEQAVMPEVTETVEAVTVPELVTGTVANCSKLNVRVKPDATADVLCVINAATELEINVNESTPEWFRVITATGVEGYCMRKFIDANL